MRRPGVPSLFKMSEWADMLESEGVKISKIAQCNYGCPFRKDTELMHFNISFDDAYCDCHHASKWWRVPWSGQWYRGPHPRLLGTQMMIPASEWKESMRRSSELKVGI